VINVDNSRHTTVILMQFWRWNADNSMRYTRAYMILTCITF